MDYQKTLAEFCAASAPSGYEFAAAQLAEGYLRTRVDEVAVHPLGSVVAIRRCGKENAKSILLDAHLDEIGFMITGIEEGFLRFTTIGGVDPRMLPDREMMVMTDPPIYGVVACLPPHIQSSEDYNKSISIKDLFLDVGMCQEEAEQKIPIGTPATYRGSCTPLGEQFLCGKAMDDRSCFAILLETLELLQGEILDVDVMILGSTQEETSSLGAITAMYGLQPTCCIAVDVTHGATPDGQKHLTYEMGGGPVIGVGPNCTKWMTNRLFEKAKELEMKVQTEVISGFSGTNGWGMQVSREGVPTALLSLPLRYMHTPVEVAHRGDLSNCAKLLAQCIRNLGEERMF